jgi:hypothetical protein
MPGVAVNDSLKNRVTKTINTFRVAAATLILFGVANVAFAFINPPVGDLVLFNRVMPGFRRFPYLRVAQEENGELAFSREGIMNLDILFPSHIISMRNKPKDEYRVILIGDSSAWGVELPLEQTAAEQINHARLKVCDDRQVVVYNLAYPGLSAIKDLMILSEAIKSYQPDMIIWSFTMNNFKARGDVNDVFANSNYGRLRALEQSTGYYFGSKEYTPRVITFTDRTLYGRRGELNLLLRLHWFDLKSMSVGTDHMRTGEAVDLVQEPAGNRENFRGLGPGDNVTDVLDINLFRAAARISGDVPIIYFNEPIYIEENNSVRYNRLHPRWIYDQYRNLLRGISAENSWTYVDMWNSLPPEEFAGVFHRTVEGESSVARELLSVIQAEACKK